MKNVKKINENYMTLDEIIQLPYAQFVDKLKELAKDSKVQSVINAGKTDGKTEDESFTFEEVDFDVKTLNPLQNEIDMDGSLLFPLNNQSKDLENILKGEAVTILGPVVVFQTNGVDYIIDGHHRWSGVYGINKDGKVNGIRLISKTKIEPARILKAAQLAIASLKKDVPTSDAKGVNLLTISEDALKSYVKEGTGSLKGFKGIQPEVIKRFSSVKKELNSVDSISDYIWQNVLSMKQTSGDMWKKLNIKRDFMPQTDLGAEGKAKDVETRKTVDKLTSGTINFIEPSLKDVKLGYDKLNKEKEVQKTEESRIIKTYEKFIQNLKK